MKISKMDSIMPYDSIINSINSFSPSSDKDKSLIEAILNNHNLFTKDQKESIISLYIDNVLTKELRNNIINRYTHLLIPFCKDIKIKQTNSSKELKEVLKSAYKNNKSESSKFILAYISACLGVMLGEHKISAEKFIADIKDLKHINILGTYDFAFMKEVFISIFSTNEHFINICRKKVFGGSFWQNDIEKKKANFIWVYAIALNVWHMGRDFLGIYDTWLKIFYKAMKTKDTELVLFMYHPLCHFYLNVNNGFSYEKQFNDDVEKPLSLYFKEIAGEISAKPVSKKIDTSKKIKIGFVYDRICSNSLTNLLYSLLTESIPQMKGKADFYLYDIEYVEKSLSDKKLVNEIAELGIKYYGAHQDLFPKDEDLYYNKLDKMLKLRDEILKDEIDVLIMLNSKEHFNFMFTIRTAPVQIFWSHGFYAYDVPGIDARLTHVPLDMSSHSGFDFNYVYIDTHTKFLDNQLPQTVIDTERGKYPKDKTILGCVGRLIKLSNPKYVSALSTVMHSFKDCVFLACGAGNNDLFKELCQEHGISEKVVLTGYVNNHLYGHIIDYYMDSFPVAGGESVREYIHKKKYDLSYGSLYTKMFDSEDENIQDYIFKSLCNLSIMSVNSGNRSNSFDFNGVKAGVIDFWERINEDDFLKVLKELSDNSAELKIYIAGITTSKNIDARERLIKWIEENSLSDFVKIIEFNKFDIKCCDFFIGTLNPQSGNLYRYLYYYRKLVLRYNDNLGTSLKKQYLSAVQDSNKLNNQEKTTGIALSSLNHEDAAKSIFEYYFGSCPEKEYLWEKGYKGSSKSEVFASYIRLVPTSQQLRNRLTKTTEIVSEGQIKESPNVWKGSFNGAEYFEKILNNLINQ
jgi:hypothetical protein